MDDSMDHFIVGFDDKKMMAPFDLSTGSDHLDESILSKMTQPDLTSELAFGKLLLLDIL